MTSVNRFSMLSLDDIEHRHVAFYLGALTRRLRRDIGHVAARSGVSLGPDSRYSGLRPSHIRLLSMIPESGARATDLSHVADMTKQALGQFMSYLEELGYVRSEPDPRDRRARVLRRTPRGDEAVATMDRLYTELRESWRDIVGPERWEVFESVTHELALGWDDPGSEDADLGVTARTTVRSRSAPPRSSPGSVHS